MASPLPKTKAPAFTENRKSVTSVPSVATPCTPEMGRSRLVGSSPERAGDFVFGGALIYQVFLHVTNERNRPAEAECPQTEEVSHQFAHTRGAHTILRCFDGRGMQWRLHSTINDLADRGLL